MAYLYALCDAAGFARYDTDRVSRGPRTPEARVIELLREGAELVQEGRRAG